jgi:hypothetical protein
MTSGYLMAKIYIIEFWHLLQILFVRLRKKLTMRKTLLVLAMASVSICAKAQITLGHSFNSKMPGASGQVIFFSSNGQKILMSDTGVNQIKLYNTDYSLWKTINLSNHPGYRFLTASSVSDNLFNSDNSVELIALYYNTSLPYPSGYKGEIVGESGVLLDLGNVLNTSIHTINDHYKLITSMPNFDTYNYKIYSLPGTLPCGDCARLGVSKQVNSGNSSASISSPIPNPSNGKILITYTLPSGISVGAIDFMDVNGKIVKSIPVTAAALFITVDNTDLPSGQYMYKLSAEGEQIPAEKMIIIK